MFKDGIDEDFQRDLNEAISTRILMLCEKNNLSINKLANMCFLTQSTLETIIQCNSKNPKLVTIIKICYGLNISLSEFFDNNLFEKLKIDNIL